MPDAVSQSAISSRWKTIPIFISSTFRDMHAERDQLNRVVFPALEDRLRERRCRLEPIDLRVGVETSATQSEREREERVLKVCLQEIERSRPFLLVLLGDRYGWVPPEERMTAATREAGFATVTSGRSVTSLEIEYGLLQKDPEQRRRSVIFLRDPLPYERMGAAAAVYSDAHGTDPGAPERAGQLGVLKTRLDADPLLNAHIHHYALAWDESARRPTEKSLETWGSAVEEAIWRQLDSETLAFARQADPSWQEQERFALEEFTERLHRGFVGRESLIADALAFALAPAGAGQAWCFAAESGAGKSALFSQVHHHLAGRDGLVLLAEAGGISPRAGRLYWTLRRWIGELADVTGVAAELPEDLRGEDLEKRFFEMLGLAASSQRVVILADALNQFERTDRMRSLSWLPDPLPPNVRFIATAIAGPETDKLSRRAGGCVTPLPPFTEVEIEAVARQVYGRYHRSVPAEVIAQLREKKRSDDGRAAAGHALWLTLALELLNLLDADDFVEAEAYADGSPEEKLRQLVLNRCAALPPGVEDLYDVFLRQVEKTAGIAEARSFAALIALSRQGWREEDLRQLLSQAAGVLFPGGPPVAWDALRFAIWRRFFRAHLVARGEHRQLDFTHVSLRQAVVERLPGEWAPQPGQDPRPALHSAMADYLETMPSGAPVRADEIMWQMLGARDLRRFAGYYAAPESHSGRLAEYLIEESGAAEHPLLDFVRSAITNEEVPQEVQTRIGHQFNFDLHEALNERDGWVLHAPLLEAAEALFFRLRQRNPQSADFARGLSVSYGNLGDLHRGLGHGEQGLEFYQKALAIVEELRQRNPQSGDDAHALSVCYNRLGDLHRGLGHGEQAREFYQQALVIAEELRQYNPQSADFARNLSASYNKLGDLHRGLGHGEQAWEFNKKAVAIDEELRQRNPQSADFARDLSVSYSKLGDLHLGLGHGEQALKFYQEALAIAEELRQRNPQSAYFASDLSVSYIKLGDLHLGLGHGEQALKFYQEALAIAEELRQRNPQSADFASDLSVSYIKLGDLHQGLGHGEQALEFYQEALAIREELRQRNPQSADFALDLSVSYERMGDLHLGLGRDEQALEFYQKSLAIAKGLRQRNPQSADFARHLSVSYSKLGDLHLGLGHGEQALKFHQKALAIAEELRERNLQSADFARKLAFSCHRMGDLHLGLGQGKQALEFYQKAPAIAEELRQRNPQSIDFARDLSVSYCNMANLTEMSGGGGAEAISWVRKAYEILADMKRRGLFVSQKDERVLAQLEAILRGARHDLHGGTGPVWPVAGDPPRPTGTPQPLIIPPAHPASNAELAAQRNIQYHRELTEWNHLSWWKRLRAKKPEPPTGI